MYSKWLFSTSWTIVARKLIKLLLFLWIFSNERVRSSDYRRMDDFSIKLIVTIFLYIWDRIRKRRIVLCWDSIRCYSCMSASYEHYFALALYQVFARPTNFTDHCNDPKRSRAHLPLVECNSICISMQEETQILGMSFTGHIRGCYDKMLIHGFNQTIVRWYKWIHRDSCHYYNKQDVLQLHNKKRDYNHRHRNHAVQSKSSSSASLLTSNDIDRNYFLKSNHHHFQTSVTDDDDASSNGKNAANQILICTCFSDGCNGSLSLNRAGWFNDRSIFHWVIFYVCIFSFWLIFSSAISY